MHKFIVLTIFSIFFLESKAQVFFPKKNYPAGTYQNPMNFPISLAGNFGECRPNHFHSGIDIRTKQSENQLVHSLQDGFVSRVKIDAGGFGNAIYITHADGYVALYAHLNKFYPELQEYIVRKQYETKSWKQDIYLMPHQFPVRKGKFIAWSGNTGSSQAPHLHLEIRSAKTENPENPLLFFTDLKDTKPPVVHKIAMYDGTKSIYEQTPQQIAVVKKGNVFQPAKADLTINSSEAYFGIHGDDYMEVASGTIGIYEMRMYVDGQPFFAWQHDDISYDITRYMNAMADYKTKKNGGSWVQLCAKLPGNQLKIYKSFTTSHGVIDLSDGQVKRIKIVVLDTKSNSSTIEFTVKGNSMNNYMACSNEFIAGKKNAFKNENLEFNLNEDCLYDNICFKTSVKPSTNPYTFIYRVHSPIVPLHSYFDLKLKPTSPIPSSLKDKIAVVRWPYGHDTKKVGKAAVLKDGMVVANVRDFGDFEIIIDQKPPSITSVIKNNDNIAKLTRLSFVAKDEITSIASCVAEVDGQWLRMVQKGDTFYYEMDSHFPSGTHTLTITATDENGNSTKMNYTLTR